MDVTRIADYDMVYDRFADLRIFVIGIAHYEHLVSLVSVAVDGFFPVVNIGNHVHLCIDVAAANIVIGFPYIVAVTADDLEHYVFKQVLRSCIIIFHVRFQVGHCRTDSAEFQSAVIIVCQ